MTMAWIARASVSLALIAGGPVAHSAQWVVGQVGPLSGTEANQGRAYGVGLQLAFDAVNKAGGVNGHTFKLARKDDRSRPEDTVAGTKQLLAEDKPLVLSGFFGSRNVADLAASGLLEKERIALVGYRTSEIRPETPLLYNVRASLGDELGKITEHLATIGVTRLGLLFEEGPGAAALQAAFDESARKAKASVAASAGYAAGTMKVMPAVDALLKAGPQAVIMVSTGAAAAAFIEQYRSAGGTAQLFAHSGADVEQMAKRLSEQQLHGVAIAQVTPNPYKITNRLAKEFGELVAKLPNLEVPVSYTMMEGYIAGKVIVEAVRSQGASPTREGTAAALDAMEHFDLGGYAVAFRPNKRTGSKFVELSIVSGTGKIRQ